MFILLPFKKPRRMTNIVNKKGKLNYSSLKYDLNDLFSDTPIFDAPVQTFDQSYYKDHLWSKVTKAVLDPVSNKMWVTLYKREKSQEKWLK